MDSGHLVKNQQVDFIKIHLTFFFLNTCICQKQLPIRPVAHALAINTSENISLNIAVKRKPLDYITMLPSTKDSCDLSSYFPSSSPIAIQRDVSQRS